MRWTSVLIAVWVLAAGAAWGQDREGVLQEEAERAASVDELLQIVSRIEPCGLGRDRPLNPWTVEAIVRGGYRVYGGEHRSKLEQDALPLLLDAALERKRRWLVPGPLAAMFRMGRAKELPAMVESDRTPAAQRVVAVAALSRAGEPTAVETLIPMLRKCDEPDLQQVIVWLLGQNQEPAAIETVTSRGAPSAERGRPYLDARPQIL